MHLVGKLGYLSFVFEVRHFFSRFHLIINFGVR